MIAEAVIGAGAITAGGFAYAKGKRAKLYRALAERIARIKGTQALDLEPLRERRAPGFPDRLATERDFLPATSFEAVKAQAERLVAPERSFVPAHKKGGTTAYETLIADAPAIVALYHSSALRTSARITESV